MAKNSIGGGDIPEFGRHSPDVPWTYTNTTTTLPYVDSREQLDIWTNQLQKLQEQQQQIHSQSYQAMSLQHIEHKLEKMTAMLDTLFNMLKLILTTQLEKEMRDKERIKEESPQDAVS